MQNTLPWIIAIGLGFVLVAIAVLWALRRPAPMRKPLPTDWSLTARPVFGTDERRVYRLLKEALPHHVVLAKLPLVRFCQPTETSEVRYWYELLGAIHVSFAICSPNGRVLAAVDLDNERSVSGRSLQIKQSVLAACRVRYLRCPVDSLPSAAELQLLVPFSNSQSRGPLAAAAPTASSTARAQRRPAITSQTPRRAATPAARAGLWQDSAVFQDSFFAPDSRFDAGTGMEMGATPPGDWRGNSNSNSNSNSNFHDNNRYVDPLGDGRHDEDEAMDDIVGVVVDSPRYGGMMGRRAGR